jgi:chemotaxis protein MotA
MSIATLLGFLTGIGLFLGAIASSTDNYMSFVSGSSIVMVLGGTL